MLFVVTILYIKEITFMLEVTIPEKESFVGGLSTSDNTLFLRAVLGETKSTQYLSRNSISFALPDSIEPAWLRPGANPKVGIDDIDPGAFFQALNTQSMVDAPISRLFVSAHNSFDMHVPLTLAPEIFWYAIVNQVAIYVKSRSAEFKHVFSKDFSDEKVLLEVRDNSLVYGQPSDWAATIAMFREKFAENMPEETLGIFLPQFSTTTAEKEAALLVNFMDTVSKYYKFMVSTLCGIPKFRFEGELADWELLLSHIKELSALIPIPGYYDDLIPVIREICEGRAHIMSHKFLDSVYKVDAESGGPYANGWLTALNAYVVLDDGSLRLKEVFDWKNGRGYTTNRFPSHVSKVDFTWNYLGTEFSMIFAGGILGIDNADGFLTPQLGVGVFEV